MDHKHAFAVYLAAGEGVQGLVGDVPVAVVDAEVWREPTIGEQRDESGKGVINASLAVWLAGSRRTVVGVDPAGASLDVARTKPLAERVTWVHGDATALAGREVDADLVVMTGNVAQVFVSNDDLRSTLAAVHDCLHLGGCLAFETRRLEVRDWERWDVAPRRVMLPDGTTVVVSRTVTEVALPLVTFESETTVNGETVASASRLRFRERDEVERDLDEPGFEVVDIRDAPNRPSMEHVFLARRSDD